MTSQGDPDITLATKLGEGDPIERPLGAARVFISYSHEDEQHNTKCLELAQRLRREGLDAWIDRFEESPDIGWWRWAVHQMQKAAFTLIVCTKAHRERFEADISGPLSNGRGGVWEGGIAHQMLSEDARNRRFIPVLFEGGEENVPLVLRAVTRYHLPVDYERLFRRLTNQPAVVAASVGPLKEFGVTPIDGHDRLAALQRDRKSLVISGRNTAHLDRQILEARRLLREQITIGAGARLYGGRFEIFEQIGRGGFATVWKGYDSLKGCAVAVKVLHAHFQDDTGRRERFFRGATRMAALNDPGIVRVVLEKGEPDAPPYFVMEYLAAGDLHNHVRSRVWFPSRAIPLLKSLAAALQHAHDCGLIHRDIKPANILLTEDGTPKLTDFDLVHATDTTGGTRTGALGTFGYAAPESMTDASRADARADIYSLGKVGLFMLYGADLPAESIRDTNRFINGLDCSDRAKAILKRACAWEARERYPSIAALRADLANLSDAEHRHRSEAPGARQNGSGLAIRFIWGKYTGDEVALPEAGEVSIGCARDEDVVLDDTAVAGSHAKISTLSGNVEIRDLGSSSGTFVNARKVSQAELRLNDRIIIGENILKLVEGTERSRAPDGQPQQAPHYAPHRELSGNLELFPMSELLKRLAASKRAFVLVARSGEDLGRVYLYGGVIAFATLNDSDQFSAMKALTRILVWDSGSFHVEPRERLEVPDSMRMPVASALTHSRKVLREVVRVLGQPIRARLRLASAVPDESLDEIARAVIEGARRQLDVGTLLNQCPHDDVAIAEAISKLMESGRIAIDPERL